MLDKFDLMRMCFLQIFVTMYNIKKMRQNNLFKQTKQSKGSKESHHYDYQYMYKIMIAIGLFIILILCVMYLLDSKVPGTHYKGNCLLDLATTYHTEGCLDD